MTIHKPRINADGSRTYADGHTYMPAKADERKMHGPRFRGEEGEWFGAKWLPKFVALLPDESREMPTTEPDYIAYVHVYGCGCEVCRRPSSLWWKRKKQPGVTLSEENLALRLTGSQTRRRPPAAETEA